MKIWKVEHKESEHKGLLEQYRYGYLIVKEGRESVYCKNSRLTYQPEIKQLKVYKSKANAEKIIQKQLGLQSGLTVISFTEMFELRWFIYGIGVNYKTEEPTSISKEACVVPQLCMRINGTSEEVKGYATKLEAIKTLLECSRVFAKRVAGEDKDSLRPKLIKLSKLREKLSDKYYRQQENLYILEALPHINRYLESENINTLNLIEED